MSPIQSNTQSGIVVKPSAADLSGKLGCFAKIDVNGNAAAAGAGDLAKFIVNDVKDATVGSDTSLLPLSGERNVRVIAGGVVTAADLIASDANGKAVTAQAGNYILGQAEESAVAGQYVLIRPMAAGAKA